MYAYQGIGEALRRFEEDICDFRNSQHPRDGVDPWATLRNFRDPEVKAFRILVCGRTGVGKSTLINKVFGVDLVKLKEA